MPSTLDKLAGQETASMRTAAETYARLLPREAELSKTEQAEMIAAIQTLGRDDNQRRTDKVRFERIAHARLRMAGRDRVYREANRASVIVNETVARHMQEHKDLKTRHNAEILALQKPVCELGSELQELDQEIGPGLRADEAAVQRDFAADADVILDTLKTHTESQE